MQKKEEGESLKRRSPGVQARASKSNVNLSRKNVMSNAIGTAVENKAEVALVRVFVGEIGGVPANVCDARELHAYLQNGDAFANWMKVRIEKYGFEESRDFSIALGNTKAKKGGQNRKDYHLSIDMAKELSMVENNEQGRVARRYFIDMERKALEAAGQPTVASHLETLLPSEQQTLSEIAHKKAEPYGEYQGKAMAEIWSRLHHKFRIAKYSQLPRTQLADAIVYIAGMQLKLAEPPREELSREQWAALSRAAQQAVCGWFLGGDAGTQWVHNRLRTEFNIRRLEELPPERVPDALALLADLSDKAGQMTRLVMGLRDAYYRDVIGAGHPWTPWLARRLGGANMIPANPDWRSLGQALLAHQAMS